MILLKKLISTTKLHTVRYFRSAVVVYLSRFHGSVHLVTYAKEFMLFLSSVCLSVERGISLATDRSVLMLIRITMRIQEFFDGIFTTVV